MKRTLCFLLTLFFAQLYANANNLQITNITLTGADFVNNYTRIEFDVSWDNSWRDAINWDAVWLFVKYSSDNGDTWYHAWLNTTPGNHTAPSGATLTVGLTNISATDRGMGVFLYRTISGSGTNTWANVQLRWEYGANGLADNTPVIIKVFGIEMVYVEQCSFYLGDGTTANIAGQFEAGNTHAPFQIASEAALTLGGTSSSNLSNHDNSGMSTGDSYNYTTTVALPAAFPKGYNASYCMKYEITQEQYKDFLNTLTRTQQGNRVPANISGTTVTNRFVMSNTVSLTARNGIRCDATIPATGPVTFYCDFDADGIYNETTDGQNIACNYLWDADVLAYLDWSGLRPMTELEYEKTCRGSFYPKVDEKAWGDETYTTATSITNSGQSTEIPGNAGANVNALNVIAGPIRVGAFATGTSTRRQAGASYYGAMEMNGNLSHIVICTGNTTHRNFSGLHGDGALASTGDQDVTNWPSLAVPTRLRGGRYMDADPDRMRISDRKDANSYSAGRYVYNGGRGVRTAP
jgi:formylglycine-generating enzyme required for sulfatase activity